MSSSESLSPAQDRSGALRGRTTGTVEEGENEDGIDDAAEAEGTDCRVEEGKVCKDEAAVGGT